MEYSLRRNQENLTFASQLVLILILMEYSLRQEYQLTQWSAM